MHICTFYSVKYAKNDKIAKVTSTLNLLKILRAEIRNIIKILKFLELWSRIHNT